MVTWELTDFIQIRAFAWKPMYRYFKYINQIWHIYFLKSTYMFSMKIHPRFPLCSFASGTYNPNTAAAAAAASLRFKWSDHLTKMSMQIDEGFTILWTNRKPWFYMYAHEYLIMNNQNCFYTASLVKIISIVNQTFHSRLI